MKKTKKSCKTGAKITAYNGNQINPAKKANQEIVPIDPNQANTGVTPNVMGPSNGAVASPELLANNPNAQSAITQSMDYNMDLDEQMAVMNAPSSGSRGQFHNPLEGRGVALGDVIGGGLAFANAMLPDNNTRADARRMRPLAYNANAMGTGSTAIYKDGGSITDADREAWEKMQSEAYKQGYKGDDHNRQAGNAFMKSQGLDPSRLGEFQADFQALSQTDPSRIKYKDELSKVDDFYGHRTSQQRYVKHQYENQRWNRNTKQYETYYKSDASFTPKTQEQWNQDAGITPVANVNPVPAVTPGAAQPIVPRATAAGSKLHAPASAGFLSKEEAIAAKKARGGNKKNWYMENGGQIPPFPKYIRNAQYGTLYAEDGITVKGKGDIEQISDNGYSNPIVEFQGPSHDEGGIPINFAGKNVEVEGDETAYKDLNGDLQIFGNMKVPGTNKKFKSFSKDIAERETKAAKLGSKAEAIGASTDPTNTFSALKFNTSRVLGDAASQKQRALTFEKEALANIQNAMLQMADQMGVDPETFSDNMENGGMIARGGKKIPKKYTTFMGDEEDMGTSEDNSLRSDDPIEDMITKAARRYNVDPKVLHHLVNTESGYDPTAESNKGAQGIMQFMPGTAKQYGVDKILKSNKPEDIAKVVDAGAKHFSELMAANGNDVKLALIAYNGGQGAIQKVRGWMGNPQAKGDEIMSYWEQKRAKGASKSPNAYHNQTYEYVNTILGDDKDKQQTFRRDYYRPQVKLPPPSLEITEKPNDDMPPLTPVPGFIDTPRDVPYIPVDRPEPVTPGTPAPVIPTEKKTGRSLADYTRMGITDFLPELGYLASSPEAVDRVRFNPVLHTPYQITLQDKLNENQATFSSLQRQLGNNPSALADLAAQKYSSDAGILGEQFRINQAIENDVINKNVGILNDAEWKNVGLEDTQNVRASQARSNTRAQKFQAAASISSKVAQNRAQDMNIRLIENMSGFRPDENMNLQWMGGDATFNTGTGSSLDPNNRFVKKVDKYGNPTTVETDYPTVEDQKKQAELLEKQRRAFSATMKKFGGII